LGLHLVVGDQVLNSTVDKRTISNFQQTMSYRDGVVNWKYTWSPRVEGDKNVKFDIEMTSFMHRTRPNVAASELKVTPRGGNYNVTIVDLLDGRSAVRSSLSEKSASVYPEIPLPENTIWISNHPEGLPDIKAWTFSIANISNGYTVESSRRRSTVLEASDDMSIGQEWDVNLVDDNVAVFHKFVGVASSDKYGMEASRVAGSTATMASFAGWNALISEHKDAWNHLMAKDRILNLRDPITGKLPVDGEHVTQLQIMHTTSHFYLLQNLLDNKGDLNDNSVSVGGLTSDTYGGMVFWDADFWMFPTILETNPDYATQIPKYRTKLYPQAKANTQEDYVLAKYKFDNESVLYSWTSGRYGNATGTGPVADYEVHLNAITAISMFQWLAVTGNDTFFRAQFWPVVNGIGHTIATLLQKDGDGYSIRNMTDPDEYAVSLPHPIYI
jgi:trehalose/maltose hydrolase-like predicted phosphorylase